MGKWIDFKKYQEEPGKKTDKWAVETKDDFPATLGMVKWYGPWRKYCFFIGDTVFEEDCMRDISDFIEQKTKEHHQKRKK